ncbi:MAG: 1-deoxy-D-xylulose-5-phosphate synthase [Gammaproteobacteria bacterium]|nr:1-deoxy-D-xylulose-5-phosphate synthase [Gammaproteobacteria bacterium]
MSEDKYPLLNAIDTPSGLRLLNRSQLEQLSGELRRFLIETVASTGGHLAAGLGVVELSVALHYVFETPEDRIVWDVGHQAYPHKILTGRRGRMHTLRQQGGLSGFPRREESRYDAFGVGHASTSISAALGMAVATKQKGEDRKIVAVIGDSSISGGMAFEAMNQAGGMDTDLLVILNDNDMAISPPVGAFRNHLAKVLSSKVYTKVREGGKSALSNMPHVSQFVGRAEEHMKGMVMPGTLFEELGFNYIGPIDGHDIDTVVDTLENMRSIPGPRLLHVVTKKGKGFKPAESDPCFYHGVPPFDPITGAISGGESGLTYTKVFGDWICDLAAIDDRLVAITPAMREGSGLVRYAENYPERYYDVGIAEEHALTFAAGISCEGLKPVVAIYSTFLQRAFDQLAHDVALQNLDVTLAVDRAGLVGADGATHSGSFDLSYVRSLPNMLVMAPADESECRQMLQTAYEYQGPAMVRYPRGTGPGVTISKGLDTLPIGVGQVVREGRKIALLAFGSMLAPSLKAAESLNATLANMRFVKPLDEELLTRLSETHEILVTLEENMIQGGAGSAVNECLARRDINVRVLNLGLPDRFIEQASPSQQLQACGLDVAGIIDSVTEFSGSDTLANTVSG